MQPILRVKPDAMVFWGQDGSQDAMALRPNLAVKIAQCIACWAEIESMLGILLGRFLETDAQAALAIFASLDNRSAQRRILNAAAEAKLSEEHLNVFAALASAHIKPLTTQRDKLAHWWWCFSPDLPDDLVIVRPNSATLSRLFDVSYTPIDQEPPEVHESAFAEHTYVVGEKYLSDLHGQMLQTKDHIRTFSASLWNYHTLEQRAEYLQQLSNEPRIRAAMDRQRADRQKNPTTQQLPPPPEPNGKS